MSLARGVAAPYAFAVFAWGCWAVLVVDAARASTGRT